MGDVDTSTEAVTAWECIDVITRLVAERDEARAENERLRAVVGSAPVSDAFLADVAIEAEYQRQHWGEGHDADKDDGFWFWTLGHIVGKAFHADEQTVEKMRHRLRAGAALLANWDRHVAARNGLPVAGALMANDKPAGVADPIGSETTVLGAQAIVSATAGQRARTPTPSVSCSGTTPDS